MAETLLDLFFELVLLMVKISFLKFFSAAEANSFDVSMKTVFSFTIFFKSCSEAFPVMILFKFAINKSFSADACSNESERRATLVIFFLKFTSAYPGIYSRNEVNAMM
jgi:hypothetical protein